MQRARSNQVHRTEGQAKPGTQYRGPGQTRYTVQRASRNQVHSTVQRNQTRYTAQRARPIQVHSTEGQAKPNKQYRGPGQTRYTVQRAGLDQSKCKIKRDRQYTLRTVHD